MQRILGLAVAAMAMGAGAAMPAQASLVPGHAIPSSAAADNGFLLEISTQFAFIPPVGNTPPASGVQFRFRAGDTTIDNLKIGPLDLGASLGAPCAPNYCVAAWSAWTAAIPTPTVPLSVVISFNGITQTETLPTSLMNGFVSVIENPVADTPEPASALLLAGGLLGLAARRRR